MLAHAIVPLFALFMIADTILNDGVFVNVHGSRQGVTRGRVPRSDNAVFFWLALAFYFGLVVGFGWPLLTHAHGR